MPRGGRAVELRWATPPDWAARALESPHALLNDHAHCELGAAAAAQSLLARRPGNARLVERMGALAVEELQHFRRVHRLLRDLGGTLRPAERNPYVAGLHAFVTPAGGKATPQPGASTIRDAGVVDRLLIAALIERRSLERFELLAACDPDGEPGRLYAELAPSEAGHANLFLELALELGAAPTEVLERLDALAGHEARLIAGLPFAPRIHAGGVARGETSAPAPAPGIGTPVPARFGR